MNVLSTNISSKKGTPKRPVDMIELKRDFGIVGDAHAAPGIRQVSLLARESVVEFEKSPHIKICLKHGIFGENITTSGIVLHELEIGTRLAIGNCALEISKIGKECHKPCFIANNVGGCIMPKEGVFAKVIEDGKIKTGDEIKITKTH